MMAGREEEGNEETKTWPGGKGVAALG